LHLIGHGQGAEQLLAAGPGIFAGGQHRPQIVAGMAGFVPRQVAVVEIKIADQGRIVEGGAIRGAPSPANQATEPAAAEILELLPHQPDGFAFERPDGAAQAVENPNLELLAGDLGQIFIGCLHHKPGEFFGNRHPVLPQT